MTAVIEAFFVFFLDSYRVQSSEHLQKSPCPNPLCYIWKDKCSEHRKTCPRPSCELVEWKKLEIAHDTPRPSLARNHSSSWPRMSLQFWSDPRVFLLSLDSSEKSSSPSAAQILRTSNTVFSLYLTSQALMEVRPKKSHLPPLLSYNLLQC